MQRENWMKYWNMWSCAKYPPTNGLCPNRRSQQTWICHLQVKCHHYWPSEGSRLYGHILVELIEEITYTDYITRKFKLTQTAVGYSSICQPTAACLLLCRQYLLFTWTLCLSVCLSRCIYEWMMLTVIVLFPYFSLVQLKESRTVRQFQYTDWPDSGMPDTGVGLVDLIGQVQKWQQHSGDSAIVVHCRFVSMFVFTNF